MLGEPGERPGVGQQDGGVDDVGAASRDPGVGLPAEGPAVPRRVRRQVRSGRPGADGPRYAGRWRRATVRRRGRTGEQPLMNSQTGCWTAHPECREGRGLPGEVGARSLQIRPSRGPGADPLSFVLAGTGSIGASEPAAGFAARTPTLPAGRVRDVDGGRRVGGRLLTSQRVRRCRRRIGRAGRCAAPAAVARVGDGGPWTGERWPVGRRRRAGPATARAPAAAGRSW